LHLESRVARLSELDLLLHDPNRFISVRGDASTPPKPPGIEWFAVPTRDRPTELRRALNSYLGNFSRFDRHPKIIVSDDSVDTASIKQNIEALREASAVTDMEAYYLDDALRSRFARLLSKRAQVPLEVAEFAFCNPDHEPHRYGVNRNALLLCTAGALMLSADDDTVCDAARFSGPSASPAALMFRGDSDVTSLMCFPDRPAMEKARTDMNIDILACHEEMLGKDIDAIERKAAHSGSIDASDICFHLRDARSHQRGRIGVTFTGTIGTLGVDNLMQLIATHTVDFAGLWRPVSSAEIGGCFALRSAPCAAVCHGGFGMSTVVGLDNRFLLPPFPPFYRNEDGIFGTLLARCSPLTFSGHSAIFLRHEPVQRRESEHDPFTIRFSDILIGVLASGPGYEAGDGTEDNLRSQGYFLLSLGSLGSGAYRKIIRATAWDFVQQLITRCKEACTRDSAGRAAEIRHQWITAVEKALTEHDPLHLIQEAQSGDFDQERQRAYLRRLGNLLIHWPSLVEAAREMGARDAGLGSAIKYQ
jgi:hypothetical protein